MFHTIFVMGNCNILSYVRRS